MQKVERRFFRGELRADSSGDQQIFLTGRAASYGVLSSDLGGFRERLEPGAFDQVLASKPDVLHLVNHDRNLILGRTKSSTTELSSDAKGLSFRTKLPDTQLADDIRELVRRGDIDECSFAFVVGPGPDDQSWDLEADPDDAEQRIMVRSVYQIAELHDISVVSTPAYPGTSAGLSRSLFPDGMPMEVRSHLKRTAGDDEAECLCECEECLDDRCEECSDPLCEDEVCARDGCPFQMERSHRPDVDQAAARERALELAETDW